MLGRLSDHYYRESRQNDTLNSKANSYGVNRKFRFTASFLSHKNRHLKELISQHNSEMDTKVSSENCNVRENRHRVMSKFDKKIFDCNNESFTQVKLKSTPQKLKQQIENTGRNWFNESNLYENEYKSPTSASKSILDILIKHKNSQEKFKNIPGKVIVENKKQVQQVEPNLHSYLISMFQQSQSDWNLKNNIDDGKYKPRTSRASYDKVDFKNRASLNAYFARKSQQGPRIKSSHNTVEVNDYDTSCK